MNFADAKFRPLNVRIRATIDNSKEFVKSSEVYDENASMPHCEHYK